MVATKIKIEVLNHKKEKPDWELLYSENNAKLDRLLEIYSESPQDAGIIYRNDNSGYVKTRMVAFTFSNGDINIVTFLKKTGISITNKRYFSEKCSSNIIYKAGTNKWYYKQYGSLRILNLGHLINASNFINQYKFIESSLYKYLEKRIGWLRNLIDIGLIAHELTFNTIISKRLFNIKAIYRHLFGIPYPIVKILLKSRYSSYKPMDYLMVMKEVKKTLINIENLKEELFVSPLFMDTCKMFMEFKAVGIGA